MPGIERTPIVETRKLYHVHVELKADYAVRADSEAEAIKDAIETLKYERGAFADLHTADISGTHVTGVED